jgi:hypothetical protein
MSKSVIQKYRKLIKNLEELKLKKSYCEIDLDIYVTSRKNIKKSIDILINRAYSSDKGIQSVDIDELNTIVKKQSEKIQNTLLDIKETKSSIKLVNKKLSNLL